MSKMVDSIEGVVDVKIPKGLIALFTLILLLLGAFASVIATGSSMNSDIEHIQLKQIDNIETISELENKVITIEKHIVETETKLTHLNNDIGVIKTDVKEILKK
ncbi:hypothetical protein GQ473_01820 [archaeon]|nr:hypothetical protein [archaeon]